jgi:hypothetical protein
MPDSAGDNNPAIRNREQQDQWMQFRGRQGYQTPPRERARPSVHIRR